MSYLTFEEEEGTRFCGYKIENSRLELGVRKTDVIFTRAYGRREAGKEMLRTEPFSDPYRERE